MKRDYSIREHYCSALWIDGIPRSFDIHHIDHDKTNNEIRNLVAIPRILHQQYHEKQFPDFTVVCTIPQIYWQWFLTYIHDMLGEFIPIQNECMKWVIYRDYLLWECVNLYWVSYDSHDT